MRGALFVSLGLVGASPFLIVLILIAGIDNNVLVDWFFLKGWSKTSTGALSIPLKLSNSTYLMDLTKVSGADFVGSNATASSLGIGNWTTISLWTSCTSIGSSVTCTTPHFGFNFNPSTSLKLDSASLQGSYGLASIPTYGQLSMFLGIAYSLALIFTVLTIGFYILSCYFPRAVVASAYTSIVATIFLLAASSAALGVFTNLKGRYNTDLVSAGIKTAIGSKPFIVSWITAVLMLLNSIMLCISHRHNKERRHLLGMAKRVRIIDHTGMDKGVGAESFVATKIKRTRTLQLLKKVGTWKSQKYQQIEKQPAIRRIPEDEYINNRSGFGGVDDYDGESELVRNSTRGIPLGPFGQGEKRDSSTAYEPFRHTE